MYDIIIIAGERDFIKIPFVYSSIVNNLTGYNKIYCFCPSYPSEKLEGINYILDKDVLQIDMSQLKFKPNWIYQQYLKLLQEITLPNYLVIDSDILFTKPVSIFENNKPCFLLGNFPLHKPFFNYSEKLFDIGSEYGKSFINETMLFNRSLIVELIYPKFGSYENFLRESNSIITSTCFPSEYELYGNYIYKYYSMGYNYKTVRVLREPTRISWSKEELTTYINKYKNSNIDMLTISSLIPR